MSLMQRMARRVSGNGEASDDAPLPVEGRAVPKADAEADRKKAEAALRARYVLLKRCAKADELGLLIQEENGRLMGNVMGFEMTDAGMRLVTVARIFVGAPIDITF